MQKASKNIEQQIKFQLDKREIKPTRDLWAEIEIQTYNRKPTNQYNGVLVAACIILLFSIVSVLYFTNQNSPEPKIVQTQNAIKQLEIEKVEDNNQALVTEEKSKKVEPNISQETQVIAIPKNHVNVPQIAVKSPKTVMPELYKMTPPSATLAVTDTLKTRKRKKSYVDASTLLFSVEHKDVINNSKSGSNVATIDLNNK